MSALLPVALWGLEVPTGDVIVPATPEFAATFRITMAAIDPSEPPSSAHGAAPNGDTPARATLKIIRSRHDSEDESEGESDEEDYLKALLGRDSDSDNESHDSEDSEGETEENGGPSDPERAKKARAQKEKEALEKMLSQDDDDEHMSVDEPNGLVNKGKAKATGDESDSGEEGEDLDVETFVICTLDSTKSYQQPLDITIGENEQVFFKVSGTHAIYLTGNYVIPANDSSNRIPDYDSEEDDEYDLSPDEDELDEGEESDELDDIANPRITEVDSDDEEEAPKLIKAKKDKKQKGKNKRPAEESEDETPNLDDIIAKSIKPAEPKTNGEQKLSKKQLKKLKNNAGEAVPKAVETKGTKKDEKPSKDNSAPNKGDKKVQFAKDLEQGPANPTTKPDSNNDKVRTVQGVKIEDKVIGKGPAAKKGNKVSMRYIGKLLDGKQFDANKKGPPFSFKLGAGEVIKGWDIGVAGIAPNGQRRLTIPAHLAYGSKDQPGIPKNSTLVFEIKCLAVK
ncbi:MAG: peptidylprolyl isomerase fpr4 [Geoglossum umbratile]|nr:MAG: peptidylprolyl isomerase fpr4 [Geoglossum umbratile]